MTFRNNRAPLLSIIKPYAWFHHHMWIQTGVTVRKRLSWVVTSVTLTFDLWPWPFAWTLLWSLVITPENFMMIRWWEHSQKGVTDRHSSNWSYSPETPKLGQNGWLFAPSVLEIWQMTLKNKRAPFLSTIKLCASFQHHMLIQTGVTVQKRLSGVMTFVFDLWPWPLAWTSLLSMVNFMMIRWGEHSEKGVTDRQTDGQKEVFLELLGRS